MEAGSGRTCSSTFRGASSLLNCRCIVLIPPLGCESRPNVSAIPPALPSTLPPWCLASILTVDSYHTGCDCGLGLGCGRASAAVAIESLLHQNSSRKRVVAIRRARAHFRQQNLLRRVASDGARLLPVHNTVGRSQRAMAPTTMPAPGRRVAVAATRGDSSLLQTHQCHAARGMEGGSQD